MLPTFLHPFDGLPMTRSARFQRASLCLVSAVVLAASLGCTDSAPVAVLPTGPQLAKGGGGTSVSSATPAYGLQGTVGKEVTITGSGFAAGDVAKWERGGVPDTKVVVRETRFVSSTQLVATIDIDADADLAFYDIAVYSADRKKGIGTEMFEVTTAESIGSLGGNTNANGANDNGEVVGYTVVGNSGQRAFYWSAATGVMVPIGGMDAFGIDQAGTTIVGVGGGYPLRWTRIDGTWTSSVLPLDATAVGGRAAAVASDPVTGEASIIGGQEIFAVKQAQIHKPRLWKNSAGSWQRVVLPMPFESQTGTISWVAAVNANGQASGAARPGGGGAAKAILWEETGVTAQYQLTVLGDGGAPAINSAGTIVAGFNNSGNAVYYKRASPTDPWSAAQVLPGGCGAAMGVDDSDRIVANGCPIPGSSRVTSAVFYPGADHTYTSYVLLGGLGDRTEGGKAYGMSRGGTAVVGTAPTKPTRVAVIWRNGF
jgi:hypothetical protein